MEKIKIVIYIICGIVAVLVSFGIFSYALTIPPIISNYWKNISLINIYNILVMVAIDAIIFVYAMLTFIAGIYITIKFLLELLNK